MAEYIETDRIREDGYWRVKCPQCRTWFEGARSTATFCGSTCRSRWARSDEQRMARIERALAAVADLAANTPTRGESKEFLALQKIATRVKNCMANVES